MYYEDLKFLLEDALANGRRLSDEAFAALCRLCLRAAKAEGRLADAVESFLGVFEAALRLDDSSLGGRSAFCGEQRA